MSKILEHDKKINLNTGDVIFSKLLEALNRNADAD